MKKRRVNFGLIVLNGFAVILATQAAYAQGFFQPLELEGPKRDQVIMAQLISAASSAPNTRTMKDGHTLEFSITGIRGGGGSKKPLGQYLVEPNMEFRSEYKDQPTETMCQFAYDLHQFIVSKGGDCRSMTMKPDSDYVPYDKQKEFAITWWTKRYPRYKKMGGMFKDWFINDALIDGTNLYNWSRRGIDGGADYIMWSDAAVQALMKKKP